METRRAVGLSRDVWVKRVNGVATLALFGSVLGGAAVGGRAYRRWSKEVNLLTAPRARVRKIRTDYRNKTLNVLEWGGTIGAVVVQIALAARDVSRPPAAGGSPSR